MYEQTAGMTSDRSGFLFDGVAAIPADAAVTMAYVPFQLNAKRYDDMDALNKGTLFVELNKPFLRGALK